MKRAFSVVEQVISSHTVENQIRMLNLRKIFTALEKERARIATDLHDELTPMLSAVKLRINCFELSDPADQLQLEKVNEVIDEIAARIRTISFQLMPPALQMKGLLPVLR